MSIFAHYESQTNIGNKKLNWLRAAVLGANDGIVSVASIVVGVAGASGTLPFVLTAGIAGLFAGGLSMGVGEYVSVSTQRDTQKALLEKERLELENFPDEEFEELASIYKNKGLSSGTAHLVARELTAHDAFAAHVDAELGIDPNDLTNPWHAAWASAVSFICGGVIPLLLIVFSGVSMRIISTFAGVLIALIMTGWLSAYAGGANKTKAIIRVVTGGMLAMLITFGVGKLFGVVGI
ncbi:MAG: Nodulin 21 family protein [Parcubacteria group bacterium GW2011_GWF1_40_5]|nr:MAG: Nodulin 21 family protein [Parcubacteria group bacterium GW2011_GWF1_40_5]